MATTNLITPEYQAILDNILNSYSKKKQEAEASGIGEAQRRGLVNTTGTSDIEGMIRASKVAPIADAEASALSNIYNQAAQAGQTERLQNEQNAYNTSERTATQDYNKLMQEYMNKYNSEEAQKQRDYDTEMLNLQRGWATSDASKSSKNWWKNALSNAGGTAAGIGVASLFSDIRLKENIKKVGTINVYEYTYKKDTGIALPTGKRIGVMAQELEKIIPQAVKDFLGYKMVDYRFLEGGI